MPQTKEFGAAIRSNRIATRSKLRFVIFRRVIFGLLLSLPLWSGTAISQEITDPQHIAIHYNEKVIETHQLEIAYSQSHTIPQSGWQTTSVNALRNLNDIRPFKEKPATIWLRYRFDRDKLNSDQLAFMMDVSRRGLDIYLNKVDIFAHNATINDQENTWNSPIFVQLPRH